MENEMTRAEALEVLRAHNAWRRGADSGMEHPTVIGRAIDVAIEALQSAPPAPAADMLAAAPKVGEASAATRC